MRLAAATAVTLLLGGEAAALTCTAAPDCADLGYTKTSCPKGGIKCPFDQEQNVLHSRRRRFRLQVR